MRIKIFNLTFAWDIKAFFMPGLYKHTSKGLSVNKWFVIGVDIVRSPKMGFCAYGIVLLNMLLSVEVDRGDRNV